VLERIGIQICRSEIAASGEVGAGAASAEMPKRGARRIVKRMLELNSVLLESRSDIWRRDYLVGAAFGVH
jgi:hypothetical protein